MKKIITMVGTSIFENYIEETEDKIVRGYVDDLYDKRADRFDAERERVTVIRSKVLEWAKEKDASAEIKSLVQLKRFLDEDIEVYLLYSDTVLSRLASEILCEAIPRFSGLERTEISSRIISGLQVNDKEDFATEGMPNLISEIFRIAGEYWQNIIINITGGYKATLPYLTILAQVNGCPIYYIFEKTDALIEIPKVPIDINWKVFKENEELFLRLEKGEDLKLGRIPEDIRSVLKDVKNSYRLNPLGEILWNKYREGFELFYLSDETKDYIERRREHKKIIDNSLLELARRLRKSQENPDLHHTLTGYTPPIGFFCFKHKEENIQIRALYSAKEWRRRRLNMTERDLYIAYIRTGKDVHNVESEYVTELKRLYPREREVSLNEFKPYRIEKV